MTLPTQGARGGGLQPKLQALAYISDEGSPPRGRRDPLRRLPSNMNSGAYSAPPVVAGLVAGAAASPASSSVAPSFNTGGSRHQLNSPSLS